MQLIRHQDIQERFCLSGKAPEKWTTWCVVEKSGLYPNLVVRCYL